MANVPGKPQRKTASVTNNKLGQATPGSNNVKPNRRKASTQTGYARRSAGVSAASVPVGDHDAGNNAYRSNGKNVARGSRRMKGVD